MTTFDFTGAANLTARSCTGCGKRFTPKASYHRKCAVCYRREKEQEVWEEAYRAGYFAGRAQSNEERVTGPRLDDATIKALITFVHPDRNPDRVEEATRLTAILNSLRGKRR